MIMSGLVLKNNSHEFIERTSVMAMGASVLFKAGYESCLKGNSTSGAVRKIVALVGSPRKGRNTDTLIKMPITTQWMDVELKNSLTCLLDHPK